MDFDGRIGRRRFIISQLILMPALTLSWSAFYLALWNLNHAVSTSVIPEFMRGIVLPTGLAWTVVAVAGTVGVVAIIANLSFTIRRLHDLGFSGWFVFLWPFAMLLVAGTFDSLNASSANCAFETVLMLVPGIAEANMYGRNPHVVAEAMPPP